MGAGAAMMATLDDSQIDGLDAGQVDSVVAALREENISLKKFIASEDAEAVFKATDGLGTDEVRLVEVLCKRTKAQLDMLSAASVAQHGKTLAQYVESDISGAFGKMMGYALLDVDDYGAKVFSAATDGVGTDESAIIDLLNTRTNKELAAIRAKWDAKNNGSLIDALNEEFGAFSKSVKKVFIAQFSGVKNESTEADPKMAGEQAKRLYKAGAGRMGTDDDVFIEILTKESRAQIQLIKAEYEKQQSSSLKKAIEKETSGALEKALVALLSPSITAYTAQALNEAFDGVGVNKDRVCRILGGTDKQMMPSVCAAYLDIFGSTLQEKLKGETLMIGDFLAATLCWCDCKDPTNGLEYKQLPTAPVPLAKHLLAERLALRSHIAENDAVLIKRACSGMGTDDTAVISVICGRTKEHLKAVDRKYHELYGKSLIQQLKGETSGNYEDLLVAIVSPYDDFDATCMKKACDGLGTNEQMIIECLASRSNARIREMKAKYDARNSTPLIDRLTSELSGSFEKLIVQLLRAERDEASPADDKMAFLQAQKLHDAGVGAWGTDEAVFADILCKSSRAQIEAIKQQYEKQYGASLYSAIEDETSGDLEDVLVALLYSPTEYWARQLLKATDGMGTDEDAVCRVLGSHDKIELALIAEHYLEVYGETLSEVLKSELGGCFEKAAVAWVSKPDPLDLHALKDALAAAKAAAASRAVSKPAVKALDPNTSMTIKAGQHTTIDPNVISEIRLGLGWQTNGEAIDLDAGVVMSDSSGNISDTVYFGNKSSQGVSYGGDNRSGDAKGDDESVVVNLQDLSSEVDALIFTVHAFSGGSFASVSGAYARLVMPSTGHELAMFKLGKQNTSQGVAFAMLKRCPGGWVYSALGAGIEGNCATSDQTAAAVTKCVQKAGVRNKHISCN